jgi:hypothetical protein
MIFVVIFVFYQLALYHMPKHICPLVSLPWIQAALPTQHYFIPIIMAIATMQKYCFALYSSTSIKGII